MSAASSNASRAEKQTGRWEVHSSLSGQPGGGSARRSVTLHSGGGAAYSGPLPQQEFLLWQFTMLQNAGLNEGRGFEYFMHIFNVSE